MQVEQAKNVVFYYPGEISNDKKRGSAIRVASMLAAFSAADCNVIAISGSQQVRNQLFKRLFADVEDGLKVDLVYAENTNSPILYGGTDRVANPVSEYQNISKLSSLGCPMGIFYRDVYWRFPMFKQIAPFGSRLILKLLLLVDWLVYQKYFDVIFLPTTDMSKYLPFKKSDIRVKSLPPGCVVSEAQSYNPEVVQSSNFSLLYVGGITKDVYDLTGLLMVLKSLPHISLTICCRESEWTRVRSSYDPLIARNVKVVHLSGRDLAGLYQNHDIAIMAVEYTEYRQFAMPVKFFEAIGFGLPIITLNQKAVAEYVTAHNLGWVVDSFSDLKDLLASADIPEQIGTKRKSVDQHKPHVTWEARSRTVFSTLAGVCQ